MNILVFDWNESISPLVRSALSAHGYRVSCESNSERTCLKIDSALFDMLIIGPAGMPEDLASRVEQEWPTLPIVVAGVERAMAPCEPIVAMLPRPLRVEDLVAAVRKIEAKLARSAQQNYDMPIDVLVGQQRLAARVVRIARDTLLIEPQNETLAAVEGPLALARGSRTAEGEVAFRDRRVFAVRLEPRVIAEFALSDVEDHERLEVGDAQGSADPSRHGGLSDL